MSLILIHMENYQYGWLIKLRKYLLQEYVTFVLITIETFIYIKFSN